jgi:phosphoglycerate dehydrogenase-like enzyme
MRRIKGLFILDSHSLDRIYGPEGRRDLEAMVDFVASPQTKESVVANLGVLADVEVIFSGWGAPRMDEAFLAAVPALRAVFYGAGSVHYFTTDAFWARGIVISHAASANAVPVSEYTLGAILFSLKRGWHFAALARAQRAFADERSVPGGYGSTVGLISLGQVGRLVRERLRAFDLRVVVYDPFVSAATARELGVELRSLDDLFRESDVVSLHTPWLKETEGMITGAHLAAMKPGSTFINTARGAVVREGEMIAVLQRRPDLQAVLDVTHPEPPAPDSPLFTLPNVVLTPHVAGAMGRECRRMGRCMVEEAQRYLAREPLRWAITREAAARTA